MDDDKKTDLLTTKANDKKGDIQQPGSENALAKVEQDQMKEEDSSVSIDSVVDDWFRTTAKQLSRDTATRNILYRALSDLKTALKEVKA